MSEKIPQITTKAITKPGLFDVLIKGCNTDPNLQNLLTGLGREKWAEEHLSLQEIVAVSPKM
jgi:hypothetical protein